MVLLEKRREEKRKDLIYAKLIKNNLKTASELPPHAYTMSLFSITYVVNDWRWFDAHFEDGADPLGFWLCHTSFQAFIYMGYLLTRSSVFVIINSMFKNIIILMIILMIILWFLYIYIYLMHIFHWNGL